MDTLSPPELPDLIVNRCPLGCDRICAQSWSNEVTRHRIICKCSCKHMSKRIASLVEKPKANAIQESQFVRRTQQYGL